MYVRTQVKISIYESSPHFLLQHQMAYVCHCWRRLGARQLSAAAALPVLRLACDTGLLLCTSGLELAVLETSLGPAANKVGLVDRRDQSVLLPASSCDCVCCYTDVAVALRLAYLTGRVSPC